MCHQLDVVDMLKESDLDDDDDDDDDVLVKCSQSWMRNNLMLMNGIHQHRNHQMIMMLVVQYDSIHNREHYEP